MRAENGSGASRTGGENGVVGDLGSEFFGACTKNIKRTLVFIVRRHCF